MFASAFDTTVALTVGESGPVLALGVIVAFVFMRYELDWLSKRAASRRRSKVDDEQAKVATHEEAQSTTHEKRQAAFPSIADTKRYEAVRWQRRRRRDWESDLVAGALWAFWAILFGGAFLTWDPSASNSAGICTAAVLLGLAVAIGVTVYVTRSRTRPAVAPHVRESERHERTEEPDRRKGD